MNQGLTETVEKDVAVMVKDAQGAGKAPSKATIQTATQTGIG